MLSCNHREIDAGYSGVFCSNSPTPKRAKGSIYYVINKRLGSSLGTTLNQLKYGLHFTLGTTYATQGKRASQGLIGQAERTRGTK